ncbi:MAG TPA: Gfo/Idh/MocA family oxidoreductase [Jatrophihabitans sp.]|jgi:myo-inositol 2-dehydrogenase/D-chiro-inositol 1-dehydrogenase|uniref:Gfo/Idh/MocA family protein n=1 Tax=Jatrophihabitans sp. TaxID=1932789 RepID=UPI002EF8B876
MTVGVAIIGTGVMGAEHARLLDREVSAAQVRGVFDLDAERAAATVARVPSARAFDDPFELIADSAVDAVVVASADPTHERFVLAALAGRKPVLCEKPLAPDVAGCERIIAAELAVGRRLVSVGFMRRFDPGYLRLKQAVDAGGLGLPLMLHCTHRNQQAPAGLPSESLISGSAVHELDIARWLLGEELSRITVHRPRSSRASLPTEDPLFLVVESSSGVIIDIEVFVNSGYGYEVRCELVAERGTVSLDAPAPVVERRAGAVLRAVPADWRPRFAAAYRSELQNWVDSIEYGAPCDAATSWDGYAATVTAQAGILALRTGLAQPVSHLDRPELYPAPTGGARPAQSTAPG